MTSDEEHRLNALMTHAGFETTGDCSPSTVAAIDAERLDRHLDGIANCCLAGRITEEQALLWTRAYWASAALLAIAANGAGS
jgi:hypothetical protein